MPGWREEKKRELEARILETALDLFRRDGFDGTSVEDITSASGIAKGTFFNYFPGKTHVLVQWYRTVTLQALAAAGARDHDSAQSAVTFLFRELARGAADSAGLFRAKTQAPAAPVVEAERELGREVLGFLAARVQVGKDGGELAEDCDPNALAELLMALLTGTGRAWVEADHSFSLEERLRTQVDLVFRGVRK